jgi:hypothetical protein
MLKILKRRNFFQIINQVKGFKKNNQILFEKEIEFKLEEEEEENLNKTLINKKVNEKIREIIKNCIKEKYNKDITENEETIKFENPKLDSHNIVDYQLFLQVYTIARIINNENKNFKEFIDELNENIYTKLHENLEKLKIFSKIEKIKGQINFFYKSDYLGNQIYNQRRNNSKNKFQ